MFANLVLEIQQVVESSKNRYLVAKHIFILLTLPINEMVELEIWKSKYVGRTGLVTVSYRFWSGNLIGRYFLENGNGNAAAVMADAHVLDTRKRSKHKQFLSAMGQIKDQHFEQLSSVSQQIKQKLERA